MDKQIGCNDLICFERNVWIISGRLMERQENNLGLNELCKGLLMSKVMINVQCNAFDIDF